MTCAFIFFVRVILKFEKIKKNYKINYIKYYFENRIV